MSRSSQTVRIMFVVIVYLWWKHWIHFLEFSWEFDDIVWNTRNFFTLITSFVVIFILALMGSLPKGTLYKSIICTTPHMFSLKNSLQHRTNSIPTKRSSSTYTLSFEKVCLYINFQCHLTSVKNKRHSNPVCFSWRFVI